MDVMESAPAADAMVVGAYQFTRAWNCTDRG